MHLFVWSDLPKDRSDLPSVNSLLPDMTLERLRVFLHVWEFDCQNFRFYFRQVRTQDGFLPVIRPRPMPPNSLPINVSLPVVWSNFQNSRRHEQEHREQVWALVNKNKHTVYGDHVLVLSLRLSIRPSLSWYKRLHCVSYFREILYRSSLQNVWAEEQVSYKSS